MLIITRGNKGKWGSVSHSDPMLMLIWYMVIGIFTVFNINTTYTLCSSSAVVVFIEIGMSVLFTLQHTGTWAACTSVQAPGCELFSSSCRSRCAERMTGVNRSIDQSSTDSGERSRCMRASGGSSDSLLVSRQVKLSPPLQWDQLRPSHIGSTCINQ